MSESQQAEPISVLEYAWRWRRWLVAWKFFYSDPRSLEWSDRWLMLQVAQSEHFALLRYLEQRARR